MVNTAGHWVGGGSFEVTHCHPAASGVTTVWPRTQDTTPGWPWLLGSELEDYGKRSATAALASLAVAAIRGDERQKTGLAGGWRLLRLIEILFCPPAALELLCTFLQTRPRLESICINMCYSDSENVQSIEICPMRWWAMAMLYIASVFAGKSRSPSCLGLVSGCCLIIRAYLQNGPNNYRSPYLWGAATV